MPKIAYVAKNFGTDAMVVIDRTNLIIDQYQAQGFILTLRQAYYQHVARGWIPNTEQSYKRLGSIVNDARLAGLIDWLALEDRTRNLRGLTNWSSPAEIMRAVGSSYRKDMWANQPYRPEVWIEKDALVGVIEGVCNELDVNFFSCRGYTSQSEMWRAGQRLQRYAKSKQTPVMFHLGDHDPSGIDMSRDIADRLELFMGGVKFDRLALNMDQVQQYTPPPNPAKITDSRAVGYIRLYGNQSWELDALEPSVIAQLIRDAVNGVRDMNLWAEREAEVKGEKDTLAAASDRWAEVVTFLGGTVGPDAPRTRIIVECEQCGEDTGHSPKDAILAQCYHCHKYFCDEHRFNDEHDCDMDFEPEEGDDDGEDQ